MRWESLEGDYYADISNEATKENDEAPSMPGPGVATRPPHHSSSRSTVQRSGVRQSQITNFIRGGNNSKDKGKNVAE